MTAKKAIVSENVHLVSPKGTRVTVPAAMLDKMLKSGYKSSSEANHVPAKRVAQ